MGTTDLYYTKEHEWVRKDEGDVVVVGVTAFAAGELGDIVFVELPEAGAEVKMLEPCGTIETVKAVADLFSPVSGKVTDVNTELNDNPELVNQSPYEQGWFLKIEMSNTSELDELMSEAQYKELTG
jgi:glycine cleavage system H protein